MACGFNALHKDAFNLYSLRAYICAGGSFLFSATGLLVMRQIGCHDRRAAEFGSVYDDTLTRTGQN